MENENIQWNFLKQAAANNRVPQAMVFSGGDFTEKKETALRFIKLLNCQSPNGKPCGKCFSCQLVEQGKHPDIIFIRPEKKDISISQIRELQKQLSLRPQISGLKSVIIEDADFLNIQSQNSLLKTLEEPSGRSLIILICRQPKTLLPTIISRCQIVKFFPRDFLFSVSQDFKEMEKILNSDLLDKMLFCQNHFGKEISSGQAVEFLENFENYLRIALLKKIGLGGEAIAEVSINPPPDFSILKIKRTLDKVSEFRQIIASTNVSPKLSLENLLISINN